MPTYDYRCNACGHRWELFQSMTAKHVKVCPSCGKRKAERLIGTGAALMFKGSGFYETDYRSASYKKAAAADKSASAEKPAATPAPAAESKPAESKPAPTTPPASERPRGGKQRKS